MRRGLMGWNAEELPLAALQARLERLRTAMGQAGLDGFVLYTNNTRPSAVAWVTGFTPYWSDGLLLVSNDRPPLFATALSKRVAEWIRSVDPISDIANTPSPGTLIGQRLVKTGARRVGILEYDLLPAGLAHDLEQAAPAVEWLDGTELFRALRREPDEAERTLLARADAIAVAALQRAESAVGAGAGAVSGLIEKEARLAGAEEAYIAIAPELLRDRRLNRTSRPEPLGERFAVRASIAYKGCWIRRTRTFAGGGNIAPAEIWLARLAAAFAPDRPVGSQLESRIGELPGARLTGWTAESCSGSYPLSVLWSSPMPARAAPSTGQFLVLTVELTLDGAPWIGALPLIVGRPSL